MFTQPLSGGANRIAREIDFGRGGEPAEAESDRGIRHWVGEAEGTQYV